jgi:hypothetical protein
MHGQGSTGLLSLAEALISGGQPLTEKAPPPQNASQHPFDKAPSIYDVLSACVCVLPTLTVLKKFRQGDFAIRKAFSGEAVASDRQWVESSPNQGFIMVCLGD